MEFRAARITIKRAFGLVERHASQEYVVMAGLDPAIHPLRKDASYEE
jgi:hypothetical protein